MKLIKKCKAFIERIRRIQNIYEKVIYAEKILLSLDIKIDATHALIHDLSHKFSTIDGSLGVVHSKIDLIEHKIATIDNQSITTHTKIEALSYKLNTLENNKKLIDVKLIKLSNSTHTCLLNKLENEIYVHFDPNKSIASPIPIDMIPHKTTGELVSHYNYAANYPPHVPLPNDIKHVIATIQGSGTHITVKALALLGEPQPYATHLHYPIQYAQLFSPSFSEIKKIIVIRDPRDNVYSRLGFKEKHTNEEKHELLKTLITNASFFNVLQMYEKIFDFLTLPNVLFIRFEDLLQHNKIDGEKYTAREKTLVLLGNFIHLPLNDHIIFHTANNLLGDTWNYEEGEHQYWQTLLPETIEMLKHNMGDLLIRLGYEVDHNW